MWWIKISLVWKSSQYASDDNDNVINEWKWYYSLLAYTNQYENF